MIHENMTNEENSREVRMNWESIAFMLGDLHTLYHNSECFDGRHAFSDSQRLLLRALDTWLETWKEETERQIATLLMGGVIDE
tara:strand:- start:977 stop:1225 length:249 start_codon:yes stop_codon:yes gene_type:complete